VADVYDEDTLAKLKGMNAIGHTRYSTAGDSSENNAQPLMVTMRYGPVALCHNGNLINAVGLRRDLEAQGALFQSTSDSEVILHLLARSQESDIVEALRETVRQIQGAFSILLITKDAVIGARDANGFRPLCIGRLNGSYAFASESCAFDLIDATYERGRTGGDCPDSREQPPIRARPPVNKNVQMHFRTRVLLAPRQHRVWTHRPGKPRSDGPAAGEGEPG